MNIAIIEDEDAAAVELTGQLERWSTEEAIPIEIKRFSYAEDFLQSYKPIYDIVFMDIMLSGIDGLKGAEKLRAIDPNVYLIFTTNMAQFAIDGYKYDAQDYFVKPISYYGLKMRMDRLKRSLPTQSDVAINIPQDNGSRRIFVENIYYIESSGHDTIYHTVDGNFKSRYKTMKQLEKELYEHNFRRCNVCYLVNLKYCTAINKTFITVAKDELIISRAKRKQFISELSDYFSGGGKKA